MKPNLNLGDTRAIIAYAKGQGVLRNQLAYILATTWHETAHTMKPVEEAFWLSDAWRKKNLRYYPWHGRGYVQITWESNYRAASKKLGIDLTADPTVVMRPEIAVQILVRGCIEGWFTAHKLPDHVTLRKSDFVEARRVVNGTDKATEIATTAKAYDASLRVAGYGVEQSAPDYVKPETPVAAPPSTGLVAAIMAFIKAIFGGKK